MSSNQPAESENIAKPAKKSLPILSVIVVAVIALIAYFAIPMIVTQMDMIDLAKKRENTVGLGNEPPPPGFVSPMQMGGPPASVTSSSPGKSESKEEAKPADEKPAESKPADEKPAGDKPE